MREFLSFSKASLMSSLRNGGELFWELFFPLILLVVFTSVSFETPKLKVYAEGLRIPEGDFEIVEDPKTADVELKLTSGILKVKIRTPDKVKEAAVEGLVWKIKSDLERGSLKRSILVRSRILGKEYNVKGYMLGGILVMVIFSSGMFTMIRVLSVYRHEGILKAFLVTPVRKVILYTALPISGPIVAILGTVAALGFSKISGVSFEIRPLTFSVAFVLTLFSSMLLGWLISLIFKTPRSAEGFGSLIYTLMPFFSGVYFPIEFLPKSIRWLAFLVPTKYMVDLMRDGLGLR